MSVAHVDLPIAALEGETAPRRLSSRVAVLIGCVSALALAAVPSVVAFLLFTRPDLFLTD